MAAQKVALITAGSAGLGAEIARQLAPDFRIVRSKPPLEISKLLTYTMNRPSTTHTMRTAQRPFSNLCTASQTNANSGQHHYKCFVYNVKTHLWLMEAAKEELEKTEGAFVTTASTAGVKPSGSSLPYAVTKAAQIHLVKSLATICSPKIRVNCVSPGLLLTEWGMKFPEARREAWLQMSKLKRYPTVEVSGIRRTRQCSSELTLLRTARHKFVQWY